MTPQTLGARLAQKRREKAAREHRDIQQTDVAKAAGVSKAAVSRYENDVDVPRERILEKIAAFLDTTPRELRYGADPAPANGTLTAAEIAVAVARSDAARAERARRDRPVPKRARGSR